MDWKQYFMIQAILASVRSKDPSTKVGCIIVDKNNHQVSMGYNGFVSGIDETQLSWSRIGSINDNKYGYVVHSEANAILHTNQSLEGCSIYVTLFPCNECAKMIASKKISNVYYLSDKYNNSPENLAAKKIFELSNIQTEQILIKESSLKNVITHLKDYSK